MNARAAFMNLMNRIFKEYLDKFIIVFINDILIYSKTWKEHEEHLRIPLQTLKNHQLYAKFSKCEFWLDKVQFLRHVISKDGVSIDSSKIETVSKWPTPKSDWSAELFRSSWPLQKICWGIHEINRTSYRTYSKGKKVWMDGEMWG